MPAVAATADVRSGVMVRRHAQRVVSSRPGQRGMRRLPLAELDQIAVR
jgi:hypothetical protein